MIGVQNCVIIIRWVLVLCIITTFYLMGSIGSAYDGILVCILFCILAAYLSIIGTYIIFYILTFTFNLMEDNWAVTAFKVRISSFAFDGILFGVGFVIVAPAFIKAAIIEQ